MPYVKGHPIAPVLDGNQVFIQPGRQNLIWPSVRSTESSPELMSGPVSVGTVIRDRRGVETLPAYPAEADILQIPKPL